MIGAASATRVNGPVLAGPADRRPDLMARRFLVACLGSRWDPAALETARSAVALPGFDWAQVCRAAIQEGVGPLLYRILRDEGLLPPSLEAELSGWYDRNLARNTRLLYELGRVLERLRTSEVPVLVLKGAALAETVYDSIALRPMVDLDVLVRQRDVDPALRVLQAAGFRSTHATEVQARDIVPYGNEVAFSKQGLENTPIEVHWRLSWFVYYQDEILHDLLWQTAQSFRLGNVPALMLGPEAQLVHLCMHLQQHRAGGDFRLLWLYDIALVITVYLESIDWKQVIAQSRALNLVHPLQRILDQIEAEWLVPIPREVLREVRALCPSKEEERALIWLSIAADSVERYALASLASLPGWGARLGFLWRSLLFPSAGYMRHRYRISKPLLLPLYYPYRWLMGLRHAL
jgi:hypothetical protein